MHDPKSRLRWLRPSWRYRLTGLKTVVRWRNSWPRGVVTFVGGTVTPRATVLFYPDLPKTSSVAYKLCAVLGYRITDDPFAGADASVLSQYATHVSAAFPAGARTGARRINEACRDISKRTVQRAFCRAFGYELAVDPLRHEGPIVEKTDENAVKDTRILVGPLKPGQVREGYVYEHLVDTLVGDDESHSYRVPIYDGAAPLVVEIHNTADERFTPNTKRARLVASEDAFSRDERERLRTFAADLSMDFGELDVLRDRRDGRIYVVDANTTPHGPTGRVTDEERTPLYSVLADAFDAMLAPGGLSRSRGRPRAAA